jgi:hypothetical protein
MLSEAKSRNGHSVGGRVMPSGDLRLPCLDILDHCQTARLRMTKLVISFNRHFFAMALLAATGGAALCILLEQPLLKVLTGLGAGLALYFVVASIIAAYLVYDRSDLYRLRSWPSRCLVNAPRNGVVVHPGFDAASRAIQARYPEMRLRILDFFDPGMMTEKSIQRARRLIPSSPAQEESPHNAWPVDAASQDVVFALSAAHEFRKQDERAAFFREAKRALTAEGRIIVIEQLRNAANFACFGPAAFHFFSRRTWLKTFRLAQLAVADEFPLTPFMRAFVLRAGEAS